jgi:hypothetical protein
MVSQLARLWALPNTMIGLLFVPAACGVRGGIELVDGVLEVHSPLIAWMLRHCTRLPGGASAITFGHVVLGRNREALVATRAHERVHVRQCERWGPAFFPAYLLASAWGLLTGDGAYHGNVFERQAKQCSRTPDSGLRTLRLL